MTYFILTLGMSIGYVHVHLDMSIFAYFRLEQIYLAVAFVEALHYGSLKMFHQNKSWEYANLSNVETSTVCYILNPSF